MVLFISINAQQKVRNMQTFIKINNVLLNIIFG